VQIPQRGGRKAREAKPFLRSATLELLAPAGRVLEKSLLIVSGRRAECAGAIEAIALGVIDDGGYQQCGRGATGSALLRVTLAYRGLSQGMEERCWRGTATFSNRVQSGTDTGDHGISGCVVNTPETTCETV
jgi:hypothetical protein